MSTKLTISIGNTAVIEAAKQYAKSNKTSLSKMIEMYLTSVTESRRKTNNSKTPILAQLIKDGKKYSTSSSDEVTATDYLMEKYCQ